MPQRATEHDQLMAYMAEHAIARARELKEIGVSATAISRAVADGDILRLGRGLYQLPDAEIDANASLAEIAKRAPNAIICLMSALAYHGLTDQLPRKVWIAIGAKDWEPKISYPKIRTVRFREPYLSEGVETHKVTGATVKIYSAAKSIADAFRNPKLVDRSVAVECLRNALDEKNARPAELADAARAYGAWTQMRPYLEALTSNG
ncbi:type IV toxin-antitoxin system AbiEi family antitoxin domain-containing protein [Hyphococcus sp.]|uniref:type IV toxin-antitoxin system AbiEi family antitoxin domain-containing protein n=1 Tax=Hyphococcus sp. TaxID=2038636 RepID=UPI0035C6C786